MQSEAIRVGLVATLIGPYMDMGMDGVRGAELAVAEMGGHVAGRPIELYKESSNAIPGSAVDATALLLDRKHVDFVIGPLSGNEGLAIRDYAKVRPDKTFINGNAAAQDITLRGAAPNFFSFSTNGVQWMAGLGSYAYDVKGYRRVATLGEDYSYPHAQVGGFMIDFMQAGGTIAQKLWVALGTTDFSAVIDSIPDDIDALFVCLAGQDAVIFLRQYAEAGGGLPLIGGSTTVDQSVLHALVTLPSFVVGMPTSGPTADSNPDQAWLAFAQRYREMFPRANPYPSLFTWGYYVNMKAALLALEQVDGDLSGNQERFREALAGLSFESPAGTIRLDHNRNAIANQFISEVDKRPDGTLFNRLVRVVPAVNQTLGIPEADYLSIGSLNRDNPPIDRIFPRVPTLDEKRGTQERFGLSSGIGGGNEGASS